MLKKIRGVWLPSSEKHLTLYATIEDWCYQPHKMLEAMKWVRKFDVAVDVGAHCGLWSRMLTQAFQKIYAFEPVPLHREAYRKNVIGDYELFPYACGETEGELTIKTVPDSSGCASVSEDGDVKAKVVRIDDYLNTECDFLKIDVEGFEEFALKGATRLLSSKPCVIVEQKPNKAVKYGLSDTGAVRYLEQLGAVLRLEIEGDYILSWND